MTPFEMQYLCASPFLPPLYGQVRKKLNGFARSLPRKAEILDVGGRKSHYTIGVPANITISELPRVSDVQKRLNLGVTDTINEQTRSRRSNIREIVFDDMTSSHLPDESYDAVVAVEVLEHVEEDARFVENVYRVLKPGGVFLMTTPNGDYVENNNADHKRHYRLEQLRETLAANFEAVDVEYAVRSGPLAEVGLYSWSLRKPLRTVSCMASNWLNGFLSAREAVRKSPQGTWHLLAVARKQATKEKRAAEARGELANSRS